MSSNVSGNIQDKNESIEIINDADKFDNDNNENNKEDKKKIIKDLKY